ncbi:MAG: hypothetical protein ACYC6G_18615 [Desulfobaccales bacterium]
MIRYRGIACKTIQNHPKVFYGMKGGNDMVIVIFFGGILAGFLLGFSGMALLSARSYRLQAEALHDAPAYQPIPPQEG